VQLQMAFSVEISESTSCA